MDFAVVEIARVATDEATRRVMVHVESRANRGIDDRVLRGELELRLVSRGASQHLGIERQDLGNRQCAFLELLDLSCFESDAVAQKLGDLRGCRRSLREV